MNQKGFESLWGDGKNGNEIKPGYASYSAYVVAENADEYQDTLEKETAENPEYSQISFYVSNMDIHLHFLQPHMPNISHSPV